MSSTGSDEDAAPNEDASDVQQEMWWDDPPADDDLRNIEGKIFVKGEFEILEQHLEGYLAIKSKGRGAYMSKTVVPKIKAFWGSKYLRPKEKSESRGKEWEQKLKEWEKRQNEWEKRQKAIANYFINRSRKRKKLRVKGLSVKVPLKKVISELYEKHIEEKKPFMTSENAIGRYSQAVKKVREELTEEESAKITQTQLAWESEGIPSEIQAKMASTQGRRYCMLFDDWRMKRLGMRCFTLETHQSKNMEQVFCLLDNTGKEKARNGATVLAFEDYNPQAVEAVSMAFRAYCKYVEKVITGRPVNVPVEDKITADSIKLDAVGIPVLPARRKVEGSEYKVKEMQSLIRHYLNKHWAAAKESALQSVKVQYKHVLNHVDDFIDKEFLPEGFELKETSRYTIDECRRLLQHWWDLDDEDRTPFRFSHYVIKGGKRERAVYREREIAPEGGTQRPVGEGDSDTDGDTEGATVGDGVTRWHEKLNKLEEERLKKLAKKGKKKESTQPKQKGEGAAKGVDNDAVGDDPRKKSKGKKRKEAPEEGNKWANEQYGTGGSVNLSRQGVEDRALTPGVGYGPGHSGLKVGPPVRGNKRGVIVRSAGRAVLPHSGTGRGAVVGADESPMDTGTPAPVPKAKVKPRPVGQEKINRDLVSLASGEADIDSPIEPGEYAVGNVKQPSAQTDAPTGQAVGTVASTSSSQQPTAQLPPNPSNSVTPTVVKPTPTIQRKSLAQHFQDRIVISPRGTPPMELVTKQLPTPQGSEPPTPKALQHQNNPSATFSNSRAVLNQLQTLVEEVSSEEMHDTEGVMHPATASSSPVTAVSTRPQRVRKPPPAKDSHITVTQQRVKENSEAEAKRKELRKKGKND